MSVGSDRALGCIADPAPAGARLSSGMADADGFDWTERKNGDVVVTHRGRVATVLRGRKAVDFLADVADGDAQELMARVTGNYKRGNERTSARHERNRGR